MTTSLKVSLTGDPRSLLEALQRSRTEALRTYGAMRTGVEQAKTAWAEAQNNVKALATALAATEAPTKKQTAELDRAAVAARRLKTAYQEARDGAGRAQQGLRNNAGQIGAAQDAMRQSDAINAARRAEAAEAQRLANIVARTRADMARAAQVQLGAERAAAAEAEAALRRQVAAQAQAAAAAEAAARRQADAQAAAAAWVRQYAAAKLAAEDRGNAAARRQAQQLAATPATPARGGAAAGVQSIGAQLAQARAIAASFVAVQGVGDLVRVVDAYTSINARLRLATRSSQELAQAQRELYAIAQRNGQALADVAGFYIKIADPVRQMGLSQADGLRVAEAVSQSLRISGAGVSESAASLNQFAQALGKGVVNGDELVSILENAPRLARAIADGLGVPVGRLKDLGEQGALTSAKVLAAVRQQIPAINREAAQIPLTIGAAITNVQSAFQRYIGGADESAGASRRIAGAINGVATNFGTVANGAVVAGNAIAVGFAASRFASIAAGAGGVAAALASWPVALALAAGAGTALWLGMGKGSTDTKTTVQGSLASMVEEVTRFGDRMSDAQRAASLDGLTAALEKSREELAKLSAEAARGEVGRKIAADVKAGEAALAQLKARQAEVGRQNLTKERGDLGVDKLRPVDLTLMDKGAADKLQAFERLYQAFVRNSINADGDLVTSYGEVRAALNDLVGSVKTPAEFDGLVARLAKALKATPGGGTAPLRAELASLIERRAQAEEAALNAQVAGLQARTTRATQQFTLLAEQARLATELSTGLARAQAELRGDTRALSADQAAGARAAATEAQQSAKVQVGALGQVEAAKRAIIESDRIAAARVATNTGIDADRAADARRRQLTAEKGSVAPDSQRAAEIAAEEKQIAADLAAEKKRLATAGADAQANAARRVADVERQAGQQRIEIYRTTQQSLASQATTALNAYKGYAQQVIDLDRQIAANRLDTAASIEALRRRDMDPAAQVDSLRAELEQLSAEASAAARAGDRQGAQDALARQKAIAADLANVQGEGINPQAMRAEAIANLQRIGEESGAILRAQREEAAAAAAQQRGVYDELARQLAQIGAEIGRLAQGEAIKLRAEVDMASVTSAVEAVRAAFASEAFAIRVAAQPMPAGADPISRATGGPVSGPGTGTSDSVPAWLSDGEHVLTAAEVAAVGGHGAVYALRAAMRRGVVPRFADGGAVGASAVAGLMVPAPVRPRTEAPLQPMAVTIPGLGTLPMQATPNVAAQLNDWARLETLKRGRMGR